MCCCCCGDSEGEIDDLPVVDGVIDFRGNHGCCRDFYCLIVLAAAVIGMIVVFAYGFSKGQPEKLYAPIDKDGGFCGLKVENECGDGRQKDNCTRKYGCKWIGDADTGGCTSADKWNSKCEEKNEKDREGCPQYIVYYNMTAPTEGICVDKCPTPDAFCVLKTGTVVNKTITECLDYDQSEYYIKDESLYKDFNLTLIQSYFDDYQNGELGLTDLFKTLGLNTNFIFNNTISLMNRCIPDVPELLKDLEQYDGLNNVFTAAVSDVKNSWWLFLVTAGITLVLCFAAICCLQCCAKIITWLLIFAAIILLFVIGVITLVYGIRKWKEPLQPDATGAKVFVAFGVAVLLAGVICLILLIALRNRISLAATLVQEASRAIKSNLCMLLVPLVYAIIFIIVLVLMLVTMVYYFSSLELDLEGDFRSIKIDKNFRYIVLFVILCFFWMAFLVIGLNQYTIAGAGAYYYFARKPEDRPTFPIARTVLTLVLHHIGSIAMGSFLIALVATIRTILLYFAQKAKEMKNEQLKCLISCLQCCMACLQKIIEFIASRAYIMMAIQGKNFWVSACDALKLLMENPLRTAFLTAISKFLVVMAEIFVTGVSVLISFFILRPDLFSENAEKPAVMYWWFIAFICAVLAFFLAWIVFQIYESLIDTLFFCFLYDEHMEKKHKDNYLTYASNDLRDYMTVVDNNARDIQNGGDGNFTNDGPTGGGGSSGKKTGGDVDY